MTIWKLITPPSEKAGIDGPRARAGQRQCDADGRKEDIAPDVSGFEDRTPNSVDSNCASGHRRPQSNQKERPGSGRDCGKDVVSRSVPGVKHRRSPKEDRNPGNKPQQ